MNGLRALHPDVFLFLDTCNVYVLRHGETALLIDFGSGAVLDHLGEIGVRHIARILMTHHHRDQGQGLPRAVEAGIPIVVPHAEQDLFQRVEAHWQARELYNNYNMRQDRFSLLESVPIAGTLADYSTFSFGNFALTVVPTPGHTVGSVSLLAERGGQIIAFTGDLIAAPGKVWSLAATQWTYNGAQGVAASILSLLDLKDRAPALLLPSHGQPMDAPVEAIEMLVAHLWELLQLRGEYRDLFDIRQQPYTAITPHLLMHRRSEAKTYVLRSDSGKALMFDFGYDFNTGLPSGSDRAARRPWLYTLPALKAQFGIENVDVVIPTHFHDDHVAGINLLRAVEGTQVWAADTFASILENPARYDLPCLWYDPIPVDRRLPLETPFGWEEYTLILYALPGHTRYAVAIGFEVDGCRVLVAGDQYQGDHGMDLNYVYANHFHAADYVKSAALYRRLQPDLLLTGHWQPLHVTPAYLDAIEQRGAALLTLHEGLRYAPPTATETGEMVRISPYQSTIVQQDEAAPTPFQVELYNPFNHPVDGILRPVLPAGWQVVEASSQDAPARLGADGAVHIAVASLSSCTVQMAVQLPPHFSARRARLAVDVTLGGQHFGQQAEALVSSSEIHRA